MKTSLFLLAAVVPAILSAASWFPFFSKPDYSMRDHRIFGEAVQNYYQTVFEENLKKYERKINRAKTRQDALKIVAAARARVKKAWNFPEKKCPLEAKVLKRKNYGDIVVENIIFKSRPEFMGIYDNIGKAEFVMNLAPAEEQKFQDIWTTFKLSL